MSEQPYKRPPIMEAVVELRFAPKLSQAQLKRAQIKLQPTYPNVSAHTQYQVALDADKRQAAFNVEASGVRMATSEQTDILILLDDRFTRSRMAPYPGWDDFRKTIRQDWRRWRPIAKPRELTRVGVRYINRIDIPLADVSTGIHLQDYFRFYPEFPEGVFGHSTYIACQQRFPIGADDCGALLNLVSAPPALLGHISFILDLDISREKDIPQDDAGLWDLLERMRQHKNRVFETAITDQSRALFQR